MRPKHEDTKHTKDHEGSGWSGGFGLLQRASTRLAAFAFLVIAMALWLTSPASGYIEIPYTLGRVVQESSTITLLRVEKVDRTKNTIEYSKIEDIKGKSPDVVKHNIAKNGFAPREWQNIMAWVQEGKTAVFFSNGSASETCIDNYWYQCYPGGEWWNMYHAEPYLLRSFAGKPDKLVTAVKGMLAGQEVVITCMIDGDKNAIQMRQERTQRLKVSLKLQEYNAARDFVGWGGDEIRSISDMSAFAQLATLPRLGGAGAWGVLPAHLENANKFDLLLYSDARISLLQNAGEGSFNEIALPVTGGARGAALCDYNGSGKPSLLLATPDGPKLLTSTGSLKFRDDSAALPQLPYWHLTAAAWITLDGAPAIVLADAYSGLRVLKNVTPKPTDKLPTPKVAFKDVSDAVGLGAKGLAGGLSVSALFVEDLNNDGAPDLLVCGTDKAVVLSGAGGRFTELSIAGATWTGSPAASFAFAARAGKREPALAVVTQTGRLRLYNFRGTTFSEQAVSLPGDNAPITSAAFTTDALGLFLGRVDAGNLYLSADPRGNFVDATESLGLQKRRFNTLALCALPGGGLAPDLVLINQNQDNAYLIARKP